MTADAHRASPSEPSVTALSFPFPTVPGPGLTLEVARGVRWVRMPLPFKLDHINLWLLEDGERWTIIDAGIASTETRELWTRIFDEGLGGKPVGGLLITHFHPDHFGLAGWLAEKWGVEIQMSETEWQVGGRLSEGPTPESQARAREYEIRCGFEGRITASIHQKDNYHNRVSPLPARHHRLREGDRRVIGGREWEVIVGRGHSPEHVCLWCEKDRLLIAGDQVLARISPNISVWPEEPEANPLKLFLESVEKLRRLPAETLVLPSHGVPFCGLQARLDELVRHHHERLAQLEAACRGSAQTVKGLMPALFGFKLAPDQIPFAIGETVAHVNYLLAEGRLERADRAEVWHFRAKS